MFLCGCAFAVLAKIYSQLYRIFPHSDDSGWTPLHIAAHMGNREFVKLLLEKGNSPLYLRNKDGLSAFHIAAKESNHAVMEELVESCSDIYELLDNKGRTALHVAAESGTYKAFSFFLGRPEFKFFLDKQGKEGNTLVHLAAINDQYMISSYLKYGRGVDLNVTNKEGFTTTDNVLLHRKLNSFTV